MGKNQCYSSFHLVLNHSKVEGDISGTSSTNLKGGGFLPSVKLVKKQFAGRYAISSEEFTSEMVRIVMSNFHLYLRGFLLLFNIYW